MISTVHNGRLPVVDALRALAASVVLVHHLDVVFPSGLARSVGTTTIMHALVDQISQLNVQAVLLFFVISGFCIRNTSRKYDFRVLNDVTEYGVKRFGRIVPPYLIALAYTFVVGIIIGATSNSSYSTATFFGNLFFLQSPANTRGTWFPPFGGNGPLWSLSFEVFYYLIYPVMTILEINVIAPRLRGQVVSVLVICSFFISNVALVCYNVSPNPIFLFVTLYYVWALGAAAEDVYRDRSKTWCLIGVLCLLGLALQAILWIRESATLESMLYGTVIAGIWLLVQHMQEFWGKFGPKALNVIVLNGARIGGISYGLYLIHYPTLLVVNFMFEDSVSGMIFAAVVSFLLATAVETAGWRIRRVILRPLSAKAAAIKPADLSAIEGEPGSKRPLS